MVKVSEAWSIFSAALQFFDENICDDFYTEEAWDLIGPNDAATTAEVDHGVFLGALQVIIKKIGDGHPEYGPLKTNYQYVALHAIYRAHQRIEKLARPKFSPNLSWDYDIDVEAELGRSSSFAAEMAGV